MPITQLFACLTIHPPEQPEVVLQVYSKKDELSSLICFIIPFENPNFSSFSTVPNVRTFSPK